MESHGVADSSVVPVPDVLGTHVNLVFTVSPQETGSFISDRFQINGCGGYTISMSHGSLADLLFFVGVNFVFPNDVLNSTKHMIIVVKSRYNLFNLPYHRK
jgi:hypothetical protein